MNVKPGDIAVYVAGLGCNVNNLGRFFEVLQPAGPALWVVKPQHLAHNQRGVWSSDLAVCDDDLLRPVSGLDLGEDITEPAPLELSALPPCPLQLHG